MGVRLLRAALTFGMLGGMLGPQARAVQLPQRGEDCWAVPTLAQDIEQKREEARAREQEQEASHPRIKLTRLTFGGQTGLPAEELAGIAKSLTDRTYTDDSGWINELQERIQDAWQHRGYFAAVVKIPQTRQVAGAGPERRFIATVALDSRRVYRLNRIEASQSSEFSPGELRDFFPMQDGEIFDAHAIQKGMEDLRKAYGTRGFIECVVIPSTAIDEVHGTINLGLEIQEGKIFRFGEIRVFGLDRLLAQRLLHESGLETGNTYDASLVGKFLERNRKVLPEDADKFADIARKINEQEGTVRITMDFRGCPPPSDVESPD